MHVKAHVFYSGIPLAGQTGPRILSSACPHWPTTPQSQPLHLRPGPVPGAGPVPGVAVAFGALRRLWSPPGTAARPPSRYSCAPRSSLASRLASSARLSHGRKLEFFTVIISIPLLLWSLPLQGMKLTEKHQHVGRGVSVRALIGPGPGIASKKGRWWSVLPLTPHCVRSPDEVVCSTARFSSVEDYDASCRSKESETVYPKPSYCRQLRANSLCMFLCAAIV